MSTKKPSEPPKEQQRAERCETCRFFAKNRAIEENSGKGDSGGQCLRFPPVYLGEYDSRDEVGEPYCAEFDTLNWMRPAVSINTWCGEWQPKKDGTA